MIADNIPIPVATLDQLLEEPGVMAACTFDPDGVLGEFKTHLNLSSHVAPSLARFCGAVSLMLSTLGGVYHKTIPISWTPHRGWIYAAGDWVIAVGPDRAAFALASDCNIAHLLHLVQDHSEHVSVESDE